MKKLITLALTLCLLMGVCSGWAEEAETEAADPALWEDPEPGVGTAYAFDFILRLHPEAFSKKTQKVIRDYAELLAALRFSGTFVQQTEGPWFELNLSVIPVSASSGAVDLRILGMEERIYIQSDLLGDEVIKLSNYSMLSFCSKMSEHLGIPLHYLALLVPYTWKAGLALPLQDWEGMHAAENEKGVIPESAVNYLWDCWDYRMTFDTQLKTLIDAICKDTEAEDAFRGVVYEIPDYFVKQVAMGQQLRILRGEHETVWRAASGEFYREVQEGNNFRSELTLPRMRTGYLPLYSLETSHENNWQSARLSAQLLGEDEEDLLNLALSLVSFPEIWPMDCYSLLSLNLTGRLFPNLGLSAYLSGERNGHVRIAFMKPTVDMEPGATMLTLEGELLPMDEPGQLHFFSRGKEGASLDIFVSNDVKIQNFLPEIMTPLVRGVFRFLEGIPTAACQRIMDDLTEIGVLDVLLGQ